MQDKTIYYKVAEHIFSVEASDAILSQMSNYAPFVTDAVDTPTFSLAVLCDTDAPAYTEEKTVRAYYTPDRPITEAPAIPEPYETFADTFSYAV